MATMTITEARASLPDVVDRVLAGEEVTLTRHGAPVVVMVRPDALRPRRGAEAFAAADRLHALLEQARSAPLPKSGSVSPERAEELVTAARAARVRR